MVIKMLNAVFQIQLLIQRLTLFDFSESLPNGEPTHNRVSASSHKGHLVDKLEM